jgi:hypothetical protein
MNYMENLYRELIRANAKYFSCVGKMESALADKVQFSFGVEYLAGDGHCITNVNTARVAPLSTCLEIIREQGVLTEEVHGKHCI